MRSPGSTDCTSPRARRCSRSRGRQTDMPHPRRQLLGVAVVLEGTVRKSGPRLRIAARLTDVRDGRHLWSQRFDRDVADVFAVQDEIAGTIVATLRATLLGDIGDPTPRRYTADLAAYNLYLKGRYSWNKRSQRGDRRRACATSRRRSRGTRATRSPTPAWPTASRCGSTTGACRWRRGCGGPRSSRSGRSRSTRAWPRRTRRSAGCCSSTTGTGRRRAASSAARSSSTHATPRPGSGSPGR